MESQHGRIERWIALALCAGVVAAAAVQQLAGQRPANARAFTPDWIPFAAAALAAAGIVPPNGRPLWPRLQRALHWSGLLLMLWATQGLLLDVLRLTSLMPSGPNWPGMATKTVALAALVVLAHLALAHPAIPVSRPAAWYGYAAAALALPYPTLRTIWALGGTVGLGRPGAGGEGWAPWLLAIPWLLAVVVSLLLVPTWRRAPRRLLLVAGWSQTAIVATIGPAAFWALVTALLHGDRVNLGDIALWVFVLFYGSWFLFAIAAGAATRSYQLRSAIAAEARRGVSAQAAR